MEILETNNPDRERIIKVDSVEEGVALMHEFNVKRAQRYFFSLLMLNEETGEIRLYERFNQPCIGEMRTYGANSTRPHDHKPRDLHTPFPDGTPIAVGHPVGKSCNLHYDLITDPITNPYAEALVSFEWSKNENGDYVGIVVTDTNVDSSLLVSFFRSVRYHQVGQNTVEKILSLLGKENEYLYPVLVYSGVLYTDGSTLRSSSEELIRNYLNKTWNRSITGGTFRNRYAYNRPDIEYVFGHVKYGTKMFQTISSYGQNKHGLLTVDIEASIKLFVKTFGKTNEKDNANAA